MIGSVHYPAHHLMPNNEIEHGMELERRDKMVRTLVRNLYDHHRREIFNAIINEYTDWENPRNHPKTIRNSLLATLGDVLYTSPLVETARMHSTSEGSSTTSNTFFFLFAHETKSWTREQPNTGIRGTLTDEHVPYILGYPLTSAAREKEGQIYTGFNNDDMGISRVMMRYVSNFVRSGDPARPHPISTRTIVEERYHGTAWPQFSPATREALLEISDRPRVRNFYRNSFVGFWNTFIPQLNRAPPSGAKVPEEHNFLDRHFDRHSFFGTVRPYSPLHNHPFPPPPLPPTPFPMESLKKLASTTAPPISASTQNPLGGNDAGDKSMVIRKSENYGLAITVAVGVGFLVLNVCIYLGMLRLCSEKRRNSTKHLKYQSYATTIPNADMTNSYLHNSTYGHQRLPPPPAPPERGAPILEHSSSNYTRKESHLTRSAANRPSLESTTQRNISITAHHAFGPHSHGGFQQCATDFGQTSGEISPDGDVLISSAVTSNGRRASLHEQEPLLTKTALLPGGSLLRSGISPTCPRHGRAAQLAASRANSIGAGSSAFVMQSSNASACNAVTANMEEVQV